MPEQVPVEDRRFDDLAAAYLAWHYAQHPWKATADGIHEYDDLIGAFSKEDFQGYVAGLYYHLRELGRIDAARLTGERRHEYRWLQSHLKAEIHETATVRWWERSPGWYLAAVAEALRSMLLPFETAERRMAHATARLRAVGPALQSARENLAAAPAAWVEAGIADCELLHRFLKAWMAVELESEIVPGFAAGLGSGYAGIVRERERLRAWEEHRSARAEALKRVEEFSDWMRKELLARASGTPAIGAKEFSELIALREFIEESPEELTRRAQAELAGLPAGVRLERVAAESLLKELRESDPGVRFRGRPPIPGQRGEIVPEGEALVVAVADPAWPAERRDSHQSAFPREALPLLVSKARAASPTPSALRRALRSRAFREGRAHLREEAGESGRRWSRARALCRWIAAVEIHCGRMTLDQAAALFASEANLDRGAAAREALRASLDPLILAEAWGRIELSKPPFESASPALLDTLGAPPIAIAAGMLQN